MNDKMIAVLSMVAAGMAADHSMARCAHWKPCFRSRRLENACNPKQCAKQRAKNKAAKKSRKRNRK